MKTERCLRAIIPFLCAVVALAGMTHLTQALPASGVVTICDDAHFTTALSGGGIVTFNCGGPATINATLKTISANTTIDDSNSGYPLTLTANAGVQLFSINSGIGLTLTNLTIANLVGASYAFPIVNNGRLILTSTNVISNYYFINNSSTTSTVTIANSTFITNSGVTVANSGAYTVTDSQFLQNAPGGSGMFVLYNNASGRVDNSTFNGNLATLLYNGGGVLTVTNSRFQQNTTGSSALIAAYNPISIDNSDFVSNTASTAIYLGLVSKPLQISNSRFYWNRSTGYASSIYLDGSYSSVPALTLTNSSLMSNTANGGAIYDYGGTMYLSNTQFISNTSNNSNGAIYLDYPNVVQILSSTFQINTGGGIYANGASNPLIVADSQFISNTSRYSAGGASVGPITLTHSSFIGNVANTVGNPHTGGLETSRQAYITDSVFLNNVGSYGGGLGLGYGGVGGPLYDFVGNTIIKGNVSTGSNGGGLYASQHLTIQDSQITDNILQGNGYGGGVYFSGYGGGGYVMTLTNVIIQNNVITGSNGSYGGGVFFGGVSGSLITGSVILSNSAGSGGGLYQNSGPLQIANTLVQSNTARTSFGGGLEAHDALTLRNVNVSNNHNLGSGGQGYGAGLYAINYSGYPVYIDHSQFTDNSASNANSQGGGIYLHIYNGGTLITNSVIFSNSAGSGGGVYHNSGSLQIANTMVQSNTTVSAGGGIRSNEALTLSNATISGNSTASDGAGVYATAATAIDHSVFLRNHSQSCE